MVSLRLVLLGLFLASCSGLPGLLMGRRKAVGQWLATCLISMGCSCGLIGVGRSWVIPETGLVRIPWSIPGGEFHVAMDPLSSFFLVPIFLISALGSVYGLGYWKQADHPHNARKLRLFYGLLTGAMGLLVVARNAMLFLFSWEVMALAAFFLVTTEDERREVRETGWIYLVATHIATLCLFAFFALFHEATGSWSLVTLERGLPPRLATWLFGLAVVAFGFKAGLMPLHVWLPGAHAITPSHVSAIMSGVIIKMGIYGLVRMTSLLGNPPLAWGVVLLTLGVVSGVLGVAYAIGQHDLKRLLAYHSIENIGIIVIGLGLALIGRALGRDDWVMLGLGGSLLHVWNHAFFKSLLFLSAGAVVHSAHTREIDHLGGLARPMPATAFCFMIGAVAICGLPPLNGFVSELLIYLGLFSTLGGKEAASYPAAAFAAPFLALIGALAVACFVKVFGAVFLGTARSGAAEQAREATPSMLAPMGILVGCCLIIGLAPGRFAPVLERAVWTWADPSVDSPARLVLLAPLREVTQVGIVLLGSLFVVGGLLARVTRGALVSSQATWACGYAAPSPRMQYTSSSFAQMLVGMYGWILRPRVRRPDPLPNFPQNAEFHSTVPDAVLDELAIPGFRFAAWAFSWFRVFQQGTMQLYILYIFIALIVLLACR